MLSLHFSYRPPSTHVLIQPLNLTAAYMPNAENFYHSLIMMIHLFVHNTHKRHPIACPWGRAMGCLLWDHRLVYCLHLPWLYFILNHIISTGVDFMDETTPRIIWISKKSSANFTLAVYMQTACYQSNHDINHRKLFTLQWLTQPNKNLNLAALKAEQCGNIYVNESLYSRQPKCMKRRRLDMKRIIFNKLYTVLGYFVSQHEFVTKSNL